METKGGGVLGARRYHGMISEKERGGVGTGPGSMQLYALFMLGEKEALPHSR